MKFYVDYCWWLGEESCVMLSFDEMKVVVGVVYDVGCLVVVYVVIVEGMCCVVVVGVDMIEYGYGGMFEIFVVMVVKGIVLCSMFVVFDVILCYWGWKGVEFVLLVVLLNCVSFWMVMKVGVLICMGGDVGVFVYG